MEIQYEKFSELEDCVFIDITADFGNDQRVIAWGYIAENEDLSGLNCFVDNTKHGTSTCVPYRTLPQELKDYIENELKEFQK